MTENRLKTELNNFLIYLYINNIYLDNGKYYEKQEETNEQEIVSKYINLLKESGVVFNE